MEELLRVLLLLSDVLSISKLFLRALALNWHLAPRPKRHLYLMTHNIQSRVLGFTTYVRMTKRVLSLEVLQTKLLKKLKVEIDCNCILVFRAVSINNRVEPNLVKYS